MQKIFIFFMLILLNINNVFGQAYNGNVVNGCDFDDVAFNMRARFEPNQHVCSLEYYMPAGYDGCVKCPTGYSCKGGTYTFNENEPQGIVAVMPIQSKTLHGCSQDVLLGLSSNGDAYNLVATFEPNTHTCNAGYYLPAGIDACTQCPVGGNCSGGTFTFNETTNQGVDSCNSGYYKDNGTCAPNTITVRWDDGNGGAYTTTCTYGGTLTTPSTPPVAPKGYHFTGWSFNLGN
jgi:hypothetical protein